MLCYKNQKNIFRGGLPITFRGNKMDIGRVSNILAVYKKKISKLLQISRVLVFVTKVTNSVTREFYKIDVIQGNKAGVSDSQSTY